MYIPGRPRNMGAKSRSTSCCRVSYSTLLPAAERPAEVKHHPSSVDLVVVQSLIRQKNLKLSKFLQTCFSSITKQKAEGARCQPWENVALFDVLVIACSFAHATNPTLDHIQSLSPILCPWDTTGPWHPRRMTTIHHLLTVCYGAFRCCAWAWQAVRG